MKENISVIVLIMLLFVGNSTLKAQDLLPSDTYYKDHIAVNKVSVSSPSLRGNGSSEDDDLVNPGGETEGGGGQVNAPIGNAIAPIMAAGLLYGSFLLYRRRKA